jgi:steroid 5-alpha reductase family enzyme
MMMVLGWLVSLKADNVTIVDSLWGMGFVLIAWLCLVLGDGGVLRGRLLVAITTIWGLRLTIYLTWRNWGKGEDPRYGAWRSRHGNRFRLVSLYKVFLVQALFMWVIALCLQYGILTAAPARLTWLDGVGLVVWAVGFFFETIGDWQLARFKSDPSNRGRVMDRGLWAYTRHPNYFGDVLVWWGIYLMVLSAPGAWWTLISPAVITLVLLKMTGVVLTEKTILATRPQYREYMRKTSAFVPWFPKRS